MDINQYKHLDDITCDEANIEVLSRRMTPLIKKGLTSLDYVRSERKYYWSSEEKITEAGDDSVCRLLIKMKSN